MERRDFIRVGSLGAAGALFVSSISPKSANLTKLTAADINKYLRSLTEVKEPSVDRIVIGEPDTEVIKIGTAWQPYWKTLREAKNAGVNIMVVHEPAFYTHWDLDTSKGDYYNAPSPGKDNYFELRDKKKQWILENKMVIIRCHDVLDKIPGWGIPYSFGQGLGFANEQIVASKTFYNVYSIDPKPAGPLAREIAKKLKSLNQPGVAFYGDENYMVKKVGLGTGCICNPLDYSELEPDLFIGIDDTIRTWTQTSYAEDTGKPLIVVNHGTSEELGVRALNKHLKETFRDLEVIHFPEGCTYKWVD